MRMGVHPAKVPAKTQGKIINSESRFRDLMFAIRKELARLSSLTPLAELTAFLSPQKDEAALRQEGSEKK